MQRWCERSFNYLVIIWHIKRHSVLPAQDTSRVPSIGHVEISVSKYSNYRSWTTEKQRSNDSLRKCGTHFINLYYGSILNCMCCFKPSKSALLSSISLPASNHLRWGKTGRERIKQLSLLSATFENLHIWLTLAYRNVKAPLNWPTSGYSSVSRARLVIGRLSVRCLNLAIHRGVFDRHLTQIFHRGQAVYPSWWIKFE